MHDIRPYLPKLFAEPGTLLYIGARPDACAWLTELAEAGHQITLLEIWEMNAKAMHGDKRITNNHIIVGDVRQVDRMSGHWDYIFWWHGPEHLAKDEIEPTLKALEAKARKLVIYACPWGVYEQAAHQGNSNETHLSYLYPGDLEGWGYEARVDGKADEAGSEIVGWKWAR